MATDKSSWLRTHRATLLQTYRRYSPVLMLGIVYGTLRLLGGLFLQLTFSAYGPALDMFQTQGQYTLAHAYPYLDYWSEYPPIFPWLNVWAYRASILLPGDPVLWFGTFSRWVLLPFDVGSVILVYLIARQLGASEEGALNRALLFVAAFVTLYVPLGWFDALPVFWLLLAVYLTFRATPLGSGLAAGVGFLAKPIVVVAWPMMWQRLRPFQSQLRLALGVVAGILLPMLPMLLRSPQFSLAFVRNMLGRSSWETIWALLDGYHSVGAVAPLAQRFDTASATLTIHSGQALYEPWLTIGVAILFLVLWTRRINWQDNGRALSFVAFSWGLFTLWSKGYSPQWAITFVPFLVLLLPGVRGAIYLLLLAVGLVAEWPLAFTLIANQQWYFDAVVIWRTLLFLLLTLEFAALTFEASAKTRLLHAANAWGATGLLVGMLVIGSQALPQYVAAELAEEPLRSTIGFLQTTAPQTGIICREVDVCERLAGYLDGRDFFWLPDAQGWQAERLPDFVAQHPAVWSVEEYDHQTGHNLAIERWLSDQYGKADTRLLDGTRLSQFVALPLPPPTPVNVTFGEQFHLDSVAYAADQGYLNLLLNWRNLGPVNTPYKLFIHVVDESGNMLTQNDQFPVGGFMPPNEWPVDSAIADLHGLVLPEDTAVSTYRVRLGWYHPDTGERLPITSTDDAGKDFWELTIQR